MKQDGVASDDGEEGATGAAVDRSNEADRSTESHTVPKDVVFGLLSAERRRLVLQYLADEGGESTLSDLAEFIASLENDKPVSALSSAERKRVYISLYQGHLPKMDDAKVLEYDQSRGHVELREEAAALYAHLEVDSPAESY